MELALDIETDGLHPWGGKFLLITIKGEDGKFTQLRGSETKKIMALKPILEDPKHIKIIHRSSFDATWIAAHYGIFIQGIFDTKIAETLILGEGEYGKTSLKDTLERYGLATLDKSVVQEFIGQKDENFTQEQLIYAAADVDYLRELKRLQLIKLAELGLEVVCELENKVAEVTYRMRVNGIRLDVEGWLNLADQYADESNKIEKKLNDHFKTINQKYEKQQTHMFEDTKLIESKSINWGSPAQVKKLLGIKSFDTLDKEKGRDPWIDLFIKMWSLRKYITTYGYSWLETERGATVSPDGRVHTDFAQIVSTGRYSSSFPNMQNVPKDTPHRSNFIPEKGNVFVSGDFSGQEIAIMAYGSQEPTWLEAIRSGKDIHSIMAKQFFPTDWAQGTEKKCTFPAKCECKAHKATRNSAKVFNFGLPYGKGSKTLSEDLDMPEKEARRIIKMYRTETPQLYEWLQSNGDYAIDYNESRTLEPFNRYRNLSNTTEEWHKRNQGYNTPVQGTGGDILKLALWYVYKASLEFKTVKLILCIHDEILTECSKSESVKWSKVLKREMERAADFVTEEGLIPVDPRISDHW
jgi:DNA polymerase-1